MGPTTPGGFRGAAATSPGAAVLRAHPRHPWPPVVFWRRMQLCWENMGQYGNIWENMSSEIPTNMYGL